MQNHGNKFIQEISSELPYEGMVINLIYGNYHIATLNCEKGLNEPEIEIHERNNNNVAWKLNAEDFINALQKALKNLKEINDPRFERN